MDKKRNGGSVAKECSPGRQLLGVLISLYCLQQHSVYSEHFQGQHKASLKVKEQQVASWCLSLPPLLFPSET